LRIGVIASEFPPDHGGMQEHARGLVNSLAADDHRVSVYTSVGHGLDAGRPNVTVRPVMRWRLSEDLPELEREPVDAWIALNAGLAPYSLGLSAPLFAYVHGNDLTRPWHPHPGRTIRLARRICGESVEQHWRKRRIAAGLRSARWMFANSAFSRGLCARMYGVPEERITVVPPGMRPEFFRTGNPGTSPRMRLITVSRLATNAERKNVGGVLQAIARLKGEIEVSYTVIGDGDDLPRLRALADGLGVAADVRFLGAVDTSRIIEEFGRHDAFVMAVKPSDEDVEGFGMVYAEAAATGLPSIGTCTGGIPEVIEHGVTGLLLQDVSVDGIADGLRRFDRNRTSFNRKIIRAKAERFSAPACTATIAETIAAMV
jgi:phosphatidylinositol alpha-1,6-mannosyltransferase